MTVFKMHPKVRYRRTRGYRHSFSTLEVVKIHTTVVKAKPKKSTSESEGKDMVKTEKVAIRKRRVVKKD